MAVPAPPTGPSPRRGILRPTAYPAGQQGMTAAPPRVDTGVVTKTPPALTAHLGPAPGDVLELVDPSTARPLSAVVEALREDGCAIRFKTPSRLRGRTRARWFDGEDAWEAAAAVRSGSVADLADLEVVEEWEPVAARQSMRVAVDRFPLLIEVIDSRTHAVGRRFDLVCVDVSATGCRATTPAAAPRRATRCASPGSVATSGPTWRRSGCRRG